MGLIVCCVESVVNFVGYDYRTERSLKGGTEVGDDDVDNLKSD